MSILNQFSLEGKTALVTGCKRGIGKAMAVALAEAGANIIGVSATLEQGSEVEKEITALGKSFKAYACDFSDRAALHKFIETVKAENPVIDILVNNAGTILREPAVSHPDEYWDTILEVNLSAQFVLSREIAKGMLERNNGKIIFTASLLSYQGGITVPGYTASKHGVAIAPGYIDTDNTEALRNNPERNKAILERIPTNRWGHIDDFKGPIVFLASQASNYVTGEILTVDGGWIQANLQISKLF